MNKLNKLFVLFEFLRCSGFVKLILYVYTLVVHTAKNCDKKYRYVIYY